MNKGRIFLFAVLVFLLSASSLSETISTPTWWDTSWHYRVGVQVNTTLYARYNWPVEVAVNFTSLMQNMSQSGTFDINSTRVVEHNSTGGVMYEVTSQFDKNDDYSSASNAAGTMIFLLNGSTPQNTVRYFYIYFDKAENGGKSPASYKYNLFYSWDGEEFVVNNTYIRWRADTIRGQNTSGLYNVYGFTAPTNIFNTALQSSKTKEYTQMMNGTTLLMFDFRNNATFVYGPIRLTVIQRGDEAYWNDPGNKTGEGFMVKKYTFYGNASWIRIEQNFTNKGSASINRSSTSGGAVSFEMNSSEAPPPNPDAQLWGNSTNPYSWYGAANVGSTGYGIVNEKQEGTSNFYAAYTNAVERMGITLNTTELSAGQSIIHRAAVNFNDTTYNDNAVLIPFKNNIANPPELKLLSPDNLVFVIVASANYTIYNRGEAALLFGDITSDPYGQSSFVNATLDMGTAGAGDDQAIVLYDDGTHGDIAAGDKIFSGYLNLTETNITGIWNLSVRAYDSTWLLLNSSWQNFNVSDIYGVATVVDNPLGLSGRVIYSTINVTNIRNDTYIPGAAINCTYGSGPLTNITDYGNGTYILNFSAPQITGVFTLNCSASKFNNSGWDTDNFYTEDATTGINMTATPATYNASNVTWYIEENFTLTINASDGGNATARSLNITLYLPPEASAESAFSQCGDVPIGSYCLKGFNLTVINRTPPGTYFINITSTWKNPDASGGESNMTFNFTVLANPKITVSQTNVSGTVGDGENREIGYFNVTSFGNTNASNTTFAVSGLPAPFLVYFTPANISSIAPNATNMIWVNVSIPAEYAPGTYNGTINASSVNGGSDNLTVQVIVPPNTTVSSSASPASYNSSNITWYVSENFTLTINTTNTGNASARYANITLYLPPVASGPPFYSCGNISVFASCIAAFNITIANQTSAGTYIINISAAWRNPDATRGELNSSFNFTVLANPKITVSQTNVSGTVGDGENREIGYFNVTSFGNVNASNITFTVTGLPASFNISFSPVNLSEIAPNFTDIVRVNVSVPQRYLAGNYTGTINASSKNGGYDTLVINVSVPENRSWTRAPQFCLGVEVNDFGTVCTIVVNNTGNAQINFTISPPQANYTLINETNFTLAYSAARYILVSYNLSGNPKGYFNATYIIYSNTSGAYPENSTFDISLYPYLEPLIEGAVSSASYGQNNSVEIYMNVTDRSGGGLNQTYTNVTTPQGYIFTANMTYSGSAGNISYWKTTYPYNFSDTNATANRTPDVNARGIYNIKMFAEDKTGAVGYSSSNFSVHKNISVLLNTPYARFPEGDSSCTVGEVNYTAKFFGDIPATGENVTLGILSSNGINWLMIPMPYVISLDGRIYDGSGQVPHFDICNSALAGNYTMISSTTFYDSASNESVTVFKNASFEVYSRPITIELVNPTFENTNIAFRVWVRDIFGSYIAPDSMNLTLFRDIFLSNGSVMSVADVTFNISDSRITRENTSIGPKYIVSLSGLSSSAAYWIQARASYGTRVGLAEKTFNPGVRTWYDVIMTMINRQASPGEYIDFELQIQNKAGNGQDVYVEYWVSNAGLEEKSWYSASMHTFVNKDAVVFVPLRAYIFPDQPYGNYWLYSRVTPSNDSSGFSWQAHDSFSVVQTPPEEPAVPPPTGGAITPPGAGEGQIPKEKLKMISIIRYPANISTVRGWTDISSIEVKNTGTLPIANLTLSITGVPSTWYTLKPDTPQKLSEANSTVYLLEFKIPDSATVGKYDLVFSARGDEVRDEKYAELNIFKTAAEMLLSEIRDLKVRLQKLETDTRFAEAAGKNVTLVWPALERAGSEITLAEMSVGNASYIEAQNHVLIAKNFLDRAENLLSSAEYIRIAEQKVIPWWLLALVILLALIAALAMLWTFRLKHRMNIFFRSPALMEKILHRFRQEKQERMALLAERDKIVRMQNLIDKEVQDGTITQQAYEELKKRTNEKLAEIDKKLK